VPPPRKPLKKSQLPTVADESTRLTRSRGALLGLAVGEAMGIPNELKNINAPDFPTLAEYPVMEPMGGGRFELKRGQTTWGTQMAVALATVLRKKHVYELREVAKAYLAWMPSAFDLPDTFKATADQILDGRMLETLGLRVWLEHGQTPRNNMALARTGVLGVFFQQPKHRDARLRATLDDTSLTNFAPICQIASVTVNAVISAAIMAQGERIDPKEIVKVAETELSYAAATLGREQSDWVQKIKEAADTLREDLKIAQDPRPAALWTRAVVVPQPHPGAHRVSAGVLGGAARAVVRRGRTRRGQSRWRRRHERGRRRGDAGSDLRRARDSHRMGRAGARGAGADERIDSVVGVPPALSAQPRGRFS
jgi:ADP-ribosyl-[dinitrogen reductase] hydrolase